MDEQATPVTEQQEALNKAAAELRAVAAQLEAGEQIGLVLMKMMPDGGVSFSTANADPFKAYYFARRVSEVLVQNALQPPQQQGRIALPPSHAMPPVPMSISRRRQ